MRVWLTVIVAIVVGLPHAGAAEQQSGTGATCLDALVLSQVDLANTNMSRVEVTPGGEYAVGAHLPSPNDDAEEAAGPAARSAAASVPSTSQDVSPSPSIVPGSGDTPTPEHVEGQGGPIPGNDDVPPPEDVDTHEPPPPQDMPDDTLLPRQDLPDGVPQDGPHDMPDEDAIPRQGLPDDDVVPRQDLPDALPDAVPQDVRTVLDPVLAPHVALANATYLGADAALRGGVAQANATHAGADATARGQVAVVNGTYRGADATLRGGFHATNTTYLGADTALRAQVNAANGTYLAADAALRRNLTGAQAAARDAYGTARGAANASAAFGDIVEAYAGARPLADTPRTTYEGLVPTIDGAWRGAPDPRGAAVGGVGTAFAAVPAAYPGITRVSAYVDFYDRDNAWVGWNAGAATGQVPPTAAYGLMCVGADPGYVNDGKSPWEYPMVPLPRGTWYYQDG